jgi:UDP-glucose 4-epimerase
MRALVTGGAGFIGSAIVRELLSAGYHVRVLDDLSTGKLENLPDDPRLEIQVGSILDPEALARAAFGCDAVSHQAAMVSVPRSLEEPGLCRALNAEGSRLVLAAARRAGARRACFASSAAVYGNDVPLPVREDGSTLSPISPYGESKLEAERLAAGIAGPEFQVAALRYFNVFGPRQAVSGGYPALVAALATAVAAGRSFTLFGDGSQTRDLVFVGDVARANRWALEAEFVAPFSALNIGTGEERSLLEVVAAVETAAGRPAQILGQPERPGDIRRSVADVSLAATLGWRAEKPFLDGVGETYAHYAGLHGASARV